MLNLFGQEVNHSLFGPLTNKTHQLFKCNHNQTWNVSVHYHWRHQASMRMGNKGRIWWLYISNFLYTLLHFVSNLKTAKQSFITQLWIKIKRIRMRLNISHKIPLFFYLQINKRKGAELVSLSNKQGKFWLLCWGLTWLLALWHIAGTTTQESHHMLGCFHLFIAGAHATPHKQATWRFQHKNIVGVQIGGSSLDLRNHTSERSK